MDRYEITVDARIDARRCRALGCERLIQGRGATTSRLLTPPVDQAGLHGVLRLVRDAGLELVAVVRDRPGTPGTQGDNR